MKITNENITKTRGNFAPKAIVILLDEMSEVMSGSNYKLVSAIQENINSIARLGRAASVHLVLATQRPSSNVINADLKNNIQQSVLLGSFDSGISSLIFDKDISHLCKPKIKGRAFNKSGNDITEFQSYWTEPEKDFKYVEVKETVQEPKKSEPEVKVNNRDIYNSHKRYKDDNDELPRKLNMRKVEEDKPHKKLNLKKIETKPIIETTTPKKTLKLNKK